MKCEHDFFHMYDIYTGQWIWIGCKKCKKKIKAYFLTKEYYIKNKILEKYCNIIHSNNKNTKRYTKHFCKKCWIWRNLKEYEIKEEKKEIKRLNKVFDEWNLFSSY